MKKRRDRMNKEYAKSAGYYGKTVGDIRSESRSKEVMKRERGITGANNRRIKPRTAWAKSITPKDV